VNYEYPVASAPHPVAILIHGECWKAEYGSLRDLAPMADGSKAKGIATWNIEYRRFPQTGSGWPGTYLDESYLARLTDEVRKDLGAK
jgi:acetyl esterase/lipase